MSLPDQERVRNRLLGLMSPGDFAALAPCLTHVDLELGQMLHRAGDRIKYVYFPEGGFISALVMLADGQPLEVGLIGSEGVAGASIVLGSDTSIVETMCQTGGAAYRLAAGDLGARIGLSSQFHKLLLLYVEAFHIQVAQTAACNAHHELGQRLARWLLGAHDRSGVDELSLTQDLISIMLGVRRSTVSVAASQLQKAGVIRYQHGRITIIDRAGLENAACECYEAVAGEYRRLLGEHPKDILRCN